MRKYLLGSLFSLFVASSVFSAPSLVNGIAFFVNGNPVTLLDVYKVQQRDKVEQNIAVDILINEKLHEEEIKKHNIIVTELELSDELNSIAKQNKTTSTQLESYIRTNGGNWESYKDEIKKRILKRKLYQIISQESLKMVNEDELRNYYNAHKEEFLIPQSIDVKKFFSKEGAALETLVKSGGKTIPKGIGQENEVLQIAALNPQIVPAFVQGKVGTFTPIYPVGEDFITFLIEAKNNPSLAPFENVRDIILQKIMSQKEDYLIYEYFEKLRSDAKVNIIRLN
ncbi:peptidyl-prolyl cis-trans isomerase [Helicobacter sp. CaF467b]|uniref:Peptidyl-prolyl cis-trans isomerase n=1 Tax=Helicobacter colisuis TaxID=2949739 RepID=A0ABT0TUJ2_9HELI|nr:MULTISPECIES: peptidyl-prolyl cis-trans isomerase [Helicobacter]MCI2235573.1 peptidyl-prolyl cis-trans isomerase [Helicobacter sp. CaF467b]MCL9819606.1 peptidyl-prolyl cis-trans isomerase [Helicobacter colisuis]